MMFFWKQALMAAIAVGGCWAAAEADESLEELLTPMRTWTNTKSQTAEAAALNVVSAYSELKAVDGQPQRVNVPTKLRMKKKSGEVVTIPLSSLSDDDQKIVKDALAKRKDALVKCGGKVFQPDTPVTLLVRVVKSLSGAGMSYQIEGQSDPGLKQVGIRISDDKWPKEMRKMRTGMLIEVHGTIGISHITVSGTARSRDGGKDVHIHDSGQRSYIKDVQLFREFGELEK